MEFSPKELLSPKDILSEVLLYTQEQRYTNVTRGFVISQMNKCLKALSYHLLFNETHVHFDMPKDRVIEIPAGVFNIKQMYLYRGDQCVIGENSENVYWKRNFFAPKGNGFVARNKGNNGNNGSDPFYSSYSTEYTPGDRRGSNINTPGTNISNTVYYYGESNGNIMLSENCSNFPRLMIKFNGIWQFDDEKPSIPSALQEVLVDWCTEAVYRVKVAINPTPGMRGLHKDAEYRLGYKPEHFDGSWYKARKLLVTMGSKKKEDLKEYLSRLNS